MRIAALVTPLILILTGAASSAPSSPPDGYWTNEEDRYFSAENGAPQIDWKGLEIETGRWRPVDAYRVPQGDWSAMPVPGMALDSDGRWMLASSGGRPTELRRGSAFTCWMAIAKYARKPDGSDDLVFASKMPLHDQGGRVSAGGGDSGAPQTIFRLRNVVWPAPSTNKPSLVLYVIRPDAPERAVSYAWADPDADLIGINLRWVQGSCSRIADSR